MRKKNWLRDETEHEFWFEPNIPRMQENKANT